VTKTNGWVKLANFGHFEPKIWSQTLHVLTNFTRAPKSVVFIFKILFEEKLNISDLSWEMLKLLEALLTP